MGTTYGDHLLPSCKCGNCILDNGRCVYCAEATELLNPAGVKIRAAQGNAVDVALNKDTEKLEQRMLVTCEPCGGEGILRQTYWVHDPYPYATDDVHEYTCTHCGGRGLIGLTIAETLEMYEGGGQS